MATIRQYQQAMRNAALPIGLQMGVDLRRADQTTRVILRVVTLLLAVICKALNDNGAVTDAQLTAALDAAVADAYPSEGPEPEV